MNPGPSSRSSRRRGWAERTRLGRRVEAEEAYEARKLGLDGKPTRRTACFASGSWRSRRKAAHQLLREELRLLPSSEVTALVYLVEVDDVGVPSRPSCRGPPNLPGNVMKPTGIDTGVGVAGRTGNFLSFFPVPEHRRRPGARRPIQRDVVDDMFQVRLPEVVRRQDAGGSSGSCPYRVIDLLHRQLDGRIPEGRSRQSSAGRVVACSTKYPAPVAWNSASASRAARSAVVGGDSLKASASPSAGVRRLVWIPISPSSPRRPMASVTWEPTSAPWATYRRSNPGAASARPRPVLYG